jgi:hypothetical protein
MLDEVERKYNHHDFHELEQAIKSHPTIGWPERGQELQKWTIGLTYPFQDSKQGSGGGGGGGGWVPTPRMIAAFQALFRSTSFSAEVHLKGPKIVALRDRR